MKKSDVTTVMAALALIFAIVNMYTVFNIMNELDNMYPDMLTLEQSVEHIRQEVEGIKRFWNLSRYNFIYIQIPEMEIYAQAEVDNGEAHFYYNGDMAIINVTLPLNTTYMIDIYAYSGPQTSLTRGSALEIICDGESWGTVTFTAEEWKWEYLASWQMYAGQHEIKLISREGGELAQDTDINFKRVRIMWLKE